MESIRIYVCLPMFWRERKIILDKETQKAVISNLEDAGCSIETIRKFMGCLESGDEKAWKEILEKHRDVLLNRVHQEEKKIDCLDYLVYQLSRGYKAV